MEDTASAPDDTPIARSMDPGILAGADVRRYVGQQSRGYFSSFGCHTFQTLPTRSGPGLSVN